MTRQTEQILHPDRSFGAGRDAPTALTFSTEPPAGWEAVHTDGLGELEIRILFEEFLGDAGEAAEAADALAADIDGPANIFILQGTQGAANVPLRQDGFTERLAELGTDWNQLDARPGDFSNVVAEETCQNAITAFPEMHIIYSMSDEMTAGCVRALESADRLDIGIASIGGNAKGIELLEQGLMPATVCQKPGTMGATALDSLLDAIVNGNERGLEFYETPVVTLDNLDDCVPQW